MIRLTTALVWLVVVGMAVLVTPALAVGIYEPILLVELVVLAVLAIVLVRRVRAPAVVGPGRLELKRHCERRGF